MGFGGREDSCYTLETFSIEGRPVRHAAVEEPNVYVVKVILRVHPITAAVVDYKAEVRSRVVCLYIGEVGSYVH